MNELIYITGHKNPDTDSICSAIAYAELKKRHAIDAVPIRIGDINKETEFVLKYFGVEVPEFRDTVRTQVSDLNMDIINPVSEDISIKSAWIPLSLAVTIRFITESKGNSPERINQKSPLGKLLSMFTAVFKISKIDWSLPLALTAVVWASRGVSRARFCLV